MRISDWSSDVCSSDLLLKILPGVSTHDVRVDVPVFGNDQDIARLSATVDAHMKQYSETPAYLIARHGLYAWGADVPQARWRVEALEFMFESTEERRVGKGCISTVRSRCAP